MTFDGTTGARSMTLASRTVFPVGVGERKRSPESSRIVSPSRIPYDVAPLEEYRTNFVTWASAKVAAARRRRTRLAVKRVVMTTLLEETAHEHWVPYCARATAQTTPTAHCARTAHSRLRTKCAGLPRAGNLVRSARAQYVRSEQCPTSAQSLVRSR